MALDRKVIILGFVGVVGLMLLGVLGLKMYLTPERLRNILAPALEASLNRTPKFAGVSLGLWGGITASIDGFELSDREGFGEEPFVAAERAAFSLRFWPLLKGEVDLGELLLVGPRISLVTNEAGETNYGDLISEEEGSAGAPSGIGLLVKRIRIVDGSLRFKDRRSAVVTAIEGIDYTLEMGLEDRRISLTGDLRVANISQFSEGGNGFRSGSVRMSHELGWAPLDNLVEVRSRIEVGSISAEIRGQLKSLSGNPSVHLVAENPDISLHGLAGYLVESGLAEEGISIQGRGSLSGRIEGEWNPEGKSPDLPKLSGKLVLKEVQVATPDLLVPFFVDDLQVELQEDELCVADVTLRAGRSDVSFSANISGLQAWLMDGSDGPPHRPSFSMKISSKVLDLDEIVPAESAGVTEASNQAGWGLVSRAYATITMTATDGTNPGIWLLRTMDGEAALQVDDLRNGGIRYRQFRAKAVAENRVLHLSDVRAELYGGRMTGEMKVDARPSGVLPVRGEVHLDRVEAEGLLQEFLKWKVPLHGKLSLDLTMRGSLDSTLVVIQKELHAEGEAKMSEGRLVNWDLLKRAGAEVQQLGFLNLDEISIRALNAPFRVKSGHVSLDKMKLTAAGMAVCINGSTGLDGALDYDLDVEVPASRLNVGGLNLGGVLSAFLGGPQATIPVRVSIGGTTNRVQVKVAM